jgi:hypothetical protein
MHPKILTFGQVVSVCVHVFLISDPTYVIVFIFIHLRIFNTFVFTSFIKRESEMCGQTLGIESTYQNKEMFVYKHGPTNASFPS